MRVLCCLATALMLLSLACGVEASGPVAFTIGDLVWNDANMDGVQNEGEMGIPGVTVNLYQGDGLCAGTTVTDLNGIYSFGPMDPYAFEYTYSVEFVLPSGYQFTARDQGGDNELDSDADPATGRTVQMTPALSTTDNTWDAGMYRPLESALGDLVWIDSDGDGAYEPEVGELGVCNVLVSVSGSTPGSMLTSCGPSAGDCGWYLFDGLSAGQYTVAVAPANFEFGMPLYGCVQTYDYEGPLDNTASYALGSGEKFLNLDFGYRPSASPGTGTPGYWKNHAQAWPVQSLVIGGVVYTKEAAIGWLRTSNDKDKTLTLFRALVCAKLNVGIGNSSSCIEEVIRSADAWMAAYGPAGAGVKASSKAWKLGEPLYLLLDRYNNGGLCAPHRD